MSIVVVGSVAFDDVTSPSGSVKGILGGAATYFSLAASYFTQVRVVAVVGEDFGAEHENVLKKRGVDTRGIERASGKTFRWGGSYSDNLNEAKTNFTDLNVFEKFQPRIPKEYEDTEFLFLANIQPTLQANVRRKMNGRTAYRMRHHELLDPGRAQGTGRDLKAGECVADQRYRDEDAGGRKEPAARGAEGAGHGAASTGDQARRIRSDDFLSRRRVRHWASSVSRANLAAR